MAGISSRNAALDAELTGLYAEHAAGLLRYATALAGSAEEGRDAAQEAFLRYFAARRFGRNIECPRAWLFQVVRNHLLTSLAAARQRDAAPEALETLAAAAENPEDAAERRERARELKGRLTPRETDCLRLRAEGCSYEEIAHRLRIRSGTVGALLAKTHRKLRWPPGNEGKVGLGTASAIHALFLGGEPAGY